MEFPKLDANPMIDNVIDKCWHNKYATVSELATHTKAFLNEGTDAAGSGEEGSTRSPNREMKITEQANGDSFDDVDQNLLEEDFLSKMELCRDLERRGVLHLLSSGEPEQIGFTFEWYRHSL